MFETGGRVHRDTLPFVHDKLVNAPAGMEAREKNRVAMARIYGKVAESLERQHEVHGWFGKGACAAATTEEEQEKQPAHPMPPGHHVLDEDAQADMLPSPRVTISGPFKQPGDLSFESAGLSISIGCGSKYTSRWCIQVCFNKNRNSKKW